MEEFGFDEQPEEPRQPSAFETFYNRENVFRTFASKLEKISGMKNESHPQVGAPEGPKNKAMDWPKAKGTCPIMFVLIVAMIYDIFLLKCLEKQLASKQLYEKAKEIAEKQAIPE